MKIFRFIRSIAQDVADFWGFGSWRETKEILTMMGCMILFFAGIFAVSTFIGLVARCIHSFFSPTVYDLGNYVLAALLVPFFGFLLCGFTWSVWTLLSRKWKSLD